MEVVVDDVDAGDKRVVGPVWASRSNGRCLFVMPTGGDFSGIMKVI
jgi:type III restriction enzyme